MESDQTLYTPACMCFEKKTIFSASKDLACVRSREFTHVEKAEDTDVWALKAPDFSLKLYSHLHLSQNKRENRCPPLFTSDSKEMLPRVKRPSHIVLPQINHSREGPAFALRYRPPDALESKLEYVKRGKYPSMAFSDPKPYDFRQYADNMPDIVTTKKKDPGNLNFKSQHLSSIGGTGPIEGIHQRATMRQFDTFKPAEPKWDSQLILPSRPWPPKSASYTRHRRRRGVHSAFMDRVEEKLTLSWKNKLYSSH
ncbi:hypothetical protein COCON_G00007370 [Conger conger]|uniref:Uncharacterized protein n=1 Tax=Conger conger TaxID=82655 RepID=A0A9Q1E1U6_CONCO|nr:uncharacterized protein si:dkey-30e9.6 [Conger conger]KAJ8288078.1 hypothetical protein COCON_G00007370 [Conger conger]